MAAAYLSAVASALAMKYGSAIAEPGDVVVCENGHEICTIVAPVLLTNMAHSTCFGEFREGQTKVSYGEKDIKKLSCAICGEQWVKHWSKVENPPRDGFLLRIKPTKGVWV